MKEREAFLDRMRAAAACAVVLLHTVTGVMDSTDMARYPMEKRVFLTVLDLVCWCVPVFLMISGYLFLDPGRKVGMGRMLSKYCRRILLALFLFGVPYACLEQIALEGRLSLWMAPEAVLRVFRGESWAHMWYLYQILFLYLLTPPLKWVLERLPRRAVYACGAALFAGCSLLPYLYRLTGREGLCLLPEDGIYLFYYISGYLFATGDRGRMERAADRGLLPCLALLTASGMAASRLFWDYGLRMAYNYPFTVLLSLLLFGWAAGGHVREGEAARTIWSRAAGLSFAVYLVHPVYLNLAYKLLRVTPLSFPAALSLPLFFAGTLLLSAGTAWALRKVPVLRRYVL